MRRIWWISIPVILIIIYLSGPQPSTPVYDLTLPVLPSQTHDLLSYIKAGEATHKIKPGNQAEIIFANDSLPQKTEYVIVYLHGFTASQAEGEPVHKNIARKFHCNLFLSRLADHGIDTTEALVHLSAEKYWESAKQAMAIGKQLGKKLILIGTSTGGTLSLMLAAHYPEVYALILLSPNIEIKDPNAWLLNNPWGLQIARLVLGSDYVFSKDQSELYKKYWYSKYRAESVVQLQELLESSMTAETFKQVRQPLLTLYYFKDSIHQDSVVNVSAMKEMMDQVSTPSHSKRSVAIPGASDHVIGSYIKSKDIESVQHEMEKFMKEVLKIK